MERLRVIDRKYTRFRVSEQGRPLQTEKLFDETNVLMRIMKYRVSLDFFEISDYVKKRISFFGIYETNEQLELNTFKLKSLRAQVRHITGRLLRDQQKLWNRLGGAPAIKVESVEEPPKPAKKSKKSKKSSTSSSSSSSSSSSDKKKKKNKGKLQGE